MNRLVSPYIGALEARTLCETFWGSDSFGIDLINSIRGPINDDELFMLAWVMLPFPTSCFGVYCLSIWWFMARLPQQIEHLDRYVSQNAFLFCWLFIVSIFPPAIVRRLKLTRSAFSFPIHSNVDDAALLMLQQYLYNTHSGIIRFLRSHQITWGRESHSGL